MDGGEFLIVVMVSESDAFFFQLVAELVHAFDVSHHIFIAAVVAVAGREALLSFIYSEDGFELTFFIYL